jgi:hypothetical protein
MTTLEKLVDDLAEHVADRILAKLGGSTGVSVYTTNKRGPHIPGKSRA